MTETEQQSLSNVEEESVNDFEEEEINEEESEDNWIALINHTDYEININYPFHIRKKSNKKIVSESLINGYISCNLNGKRYLKHRLIAQQFIRLSLTIFLFDFFLIWKG